MFGYVAAENQLTRIMMMRETHTLLFDFACDNEEVVLYNNVWCIIKLVVWCSNWRFLLVALYSALCIERHTYKIDLF